MGWLMQGELRVDDQGVSRCWWCGDDPLYVAYHDTEWGRPLTTDDEWFEKICLEGFQAGLAWITILRKRDNFRAAFDRFHIETIVRYDDSDVQRLLGDAGIVRHRGKIASVINNAGRAIELRTEFGSLDAFMEQYRPERAPGLALTDDIPATSAESTAMSKALRSRGWTFVGPTTMYAMMQSAGLVDDHLLGCHRRPAP